MALTIIYSSYLDFSSIYLFSWSFCLLKCLFSLLKSKKYLKEWNFSQDVDHVYSRFFCSAARKPPQNTLLLVVFRKGKLVFYVALEQIYNLAIFKVEIALVDNYL